LESHNDLSWLPTQPSWLLLRVPLSSGCSLACPEGGRASGGQLQQRGCCCQGRPGLRGSGCGCSLAGPVRAGPAHGRLLGLCALGSARCPWLQLRHLALRICRSRGTGQPLPRSELREGAACGRVRAAAQLPRSGAAVAPPKRAGAPGWQLQGCRAMLGGLAPSCARWGDGAGTRLGVRQQQRQVFSPLEPACVWQAEGESEGDVHRPLQELFLRGAEPPLVSASAQSGSPPAGTGGCCTSTRSSPAAPHPAKRFPGSYLE